MFFMVLNIVVYGFEYDFLWVWICFFGFDLVWDRPRTWVGTVVGPGGMEGAYPNHIVNHIFLKIKKTHIQIAKKTKMVRGFKKSDA